MCNKRNEITENLRNIYSQVLNREISSEEFVDGINLIEKFHIDSLIALQIIVKIEQNFSIVIEDDNFAIEMLSSVSKSVDFISENGQ